MNSKHLFTTLVLLIVTLVSCHSQVASTYTIEGKIEGLTDGTKVDLIPTATHKNEKAIATAVVTDGKFVFKGMVDGPRCFYIQVSGIYGGTKLIVDNATIKVSGKATYSERDGNKFCQFTEVKVEGSDSQSLYLEKIATRNILDSLYQAYHENNREISEAMSKARMEKNKILLDSLSKTKAAEKFATDEKAFFDRVASTMKKLIISNKDSWWGPFFMMDQMSYFSPEQNEWFESFSPEAKNSYYGKLVKKELYPENLVGKPAPAFTVIDKNKRKITSSKLISGKKYTLIDFWASWCMPCRKEIPNLKQLYAKYASKGLEIVSISIDKKESDWIKALKEEQLSWPNFLDQTGVADIYNVKLIPTLYLLDEKGKIVSDKLRGESLAKELEKLFK